MGISERRKEIKRRRHRRKKCEHLKQRAEKASPAEKEVIASKLRGLTPGADVIIDKLGLRS